VGANPATTDHVAGSGRSAPAFGPRPQGPRPARGLSGSEAAARLTRYGPNVVARRKPVPLWRRVTAQLRDPLIVVLLVAAVLTVATGDWSDAVVVLLVIVVNTAVGVSQEARADEAVAALANLSAPRARVRRDGEQQEIPAADVVPGDVILLGEGDVVPADAQVLEAAVLLVDESALTGESVPVEKETIRPDGEPGTVSAGTVVLRGRGVALVTATGADSAMGRIASLLEEERGLTPLQRRLVQVGRMLAMVIVAVSSVVLLLGLLRGEPAELMIVTAISLVVAAVPESLPAVITLSLALGARRMAARRAIVRHLPAVETLGSVTVIATDKTGTLTEGRMVAERLWTPVGEAVVTGTGYGPRGDVRRDGAVTSGAEAPDLAELLRAGVLCNDAALRAVDDAPGERVALGDPTEAALIVAAGKLGIHRDAADHEYPRVAEIPFTSERKLMTTVHETPSGERLVVCKGAPEMVLRRPVVRDEHHTIRRALERAEEFAHEGFRVLAVAARRLAAATPDDDPAGAGNDLERDLVLLGLVAITDPPRPSAGATIAACRAAGITPVLITGDHPATARTLALRAGLVDGDTEVVDGRTLSPGDIAGLGHIQVFARTSPEQKVEIVQARRRAGHVVAMTGDGVNDGPALHQADIGVAMGRRGTDVARQAADLVLADDELGTLVSAVEEGRRIYANVRRFLLYALSGGTAELLIMLAGPFLGMPLPLLPAQILWVNLVTHGLAGVALGAEPAEPDIMSQPPRSPAESILGAGLWQRILRIGLLLAVASLAVGVWAEATGRPWQTMLFLTLGATQLAVALASRARPRTLGNPFLLVAAAGAFLLQLAGCYLPPLQALLDTQALSAADVLVALGVAAVGYVGIRLDRVLHPTRPTPTTHATQG
jgi:Ca2+-transporting ATPase